MISILGKILTFNIHKYFTSKYTIKKNAEHINFRGESGLMVLMNLFLKILISQQLPDGRDGYKISLYFILRSAVNRRMSKLS